MNVRWPSEFNGSAIWMHDQVWTWNVTGGFSMGRSHWASPFRESLPITRSEVGL